MSTCSFKWLRWTAPLRRVGLTARSHAPRQILELCRSSCSSGPWRCRWCTPHLRTPSQTCKRHQTQATWMWDDILEPRLRMIHTIQKNRHKHAVKMSFRLHSINQCLIWRAQGRDLAVLSTKVRCAVTPNHVKNYQSLLIDQIRTNIQTNSMYFEQQYTNHQYKNVSRTCSMTPYMIRGCQIKTSAHEDDILISSEFGEVAGEWCSV